uniref:MerR family transcriptional regulator n=1 Tax=Lachnospira sp. TaxID=2049031 RepID=UPI0040289C91
MRITLNKTIDNTIYYTSGQFAKKAHVSVRTIRFYDQQNILKPSKLDKNGSRFYTDNDFVKLQQILLFKYLGFSLEEIKSLTITDSDNSMLINSLKLQQKLVRDKIEQLELVSDAIEQTSCALKSDNSINWNGLLTLIHLTGMQNSLKTQYLNASNISARISLHQMYSTGRPGWFQWIYDNCSISRNMNILELGCG